VPLLNLCVKLRHALVVKGHLTAHKDVEDNAETPNIDFGASVLLGLEQFWSGKVQTSTKCLELVSGGEEVAQAKIDDLDVAHFTDENVLNLQVTVDNAVPVAVVKCTGNLPGELAGLLFLQASMGDDVVEHLSAVDKLEHHVPVEVCPDDILHAADVGVVEQADNGSFSGGANFLGVVGPFAIGGALVLVLRLSRDDLDGGLDLVSKGRLLDCSSRPRNAGTGVGGRMRKGEHMWYACPLGR